MNLPSNNTHFEPRAQRLPVAGNSTKHMKLYIAHQLIVEADVHLQVLARNKATKLLTTLAIIQFVTKYISLQLLKYMEESSKSQ